MHVMGRPFEQQTVVTDNGVEVEEETCEYQLTQDLVYLWEVSINQYVQREAQESGP